MKSLDQLRIGETARIAVIQGDCTATARLMEMGLCEGEPVQLIGRAPLGDPMTFLIRGSRMALRACEARRVRVDLNGDERPAVPLNEDERPAVPA